MGQISYIQLYAAFLKFLDIDNQSSAVWLLNTQQKKNRWPRNAHCTVQCRIVSLCRFDLLNMFDEQLRNASLEIYLLLVLVQQTSQYSGGSRYPALSLSILLISGESD